MRRTSAETATGASALMLATGVAAAISGAYLTLWTLPLRLLFVIFEPSLLANGMWSDLTAYVLSWLTLMVGGVVVYRGLRRTRDGSSVARPTAGGRGDPAMILAGLWSAIAYLWHVDSLVTGGVRLGWAEGIVCAAIAFWITVGVKLPRRAPSTWPSSTRCLARILRQPNSA